MWNATIVWMGVRVEWFASTYIPWYAPKQNFYTNILYVLPSNNACIVSIYQSKLPVLKITPLLSQLIYTSNNVIIVLLLLVFRWDYFKISFIPMHIYQKDNPTTCFFTLLYPFVPLFINFRIPNYCVFVYV